MSQIKAKPLLQFSISTYEERQRQRRDNDRDDVDCVSQSMATAEASPSPSPNRSPVSPSIIPTKIAAPHSPPAQPQSQSKAIAKNLYLATGKSSPSPPPPPPPEYGGLNEAEISPPIEFADDVPKNKASIVAPSAAKSCPSNGNATLAKRMATTSASVIADNGHNRQKFVEKPLTPTPDYDSLVYGNGNAEEHSVVKSVIPPPPPPQPLNGVGLGSFGGFKGVSSKGPAPPKPNRSVSVTIGEYDSKREPSRLGFLNKMNSVGGQSTSEMLQNELQMTLSRSNLRKTSEVGKGQNVNGAGGAVAVNGTKSVLEKTGSANIEKLTSMLNARNATVTNGSTKVTISIPKSTTQIGDSEAVKVSPNGILKTVGGTIGNSVGVANGNGAANGGESKNIKFDNIATVIGIRK